MAPKKTVGEKQALGEVKARKKAPKRPDVAKKQKRVQKIMEDPEVQVKLKKKVATKRAAKDISKVAKAGGDDTRSLRANVKPKRAPKRQKKEGDEVVSDSGPKSKSVRSRNAPKSNKNASAVAGSS